MSSPSAPRRVVDIFVVGLGVMSVRQVTREVEDAIRRSNTVLYVDAGFGVEDFLRTLCPRTRSLAGHYKEQGDRTQTYRAMAAEVLDSALADPPVCFATYGHPGMYVYPTRLIARGAARLDLTVRVLPGISALDTIILDLGLDPGVRGLQMYEATDAIARARPLQPDVPCLLWQVGALESAFYSARPGNAQRFARLQRYLLQTYPADHPVTMVLSSGYPLLDPVRETFVVGELAEHLARGGQAGTLYLPPVTDRPVHDPDLLRDTQDPDHLAKITAPSPDA